MKNNFPSGYAANLLKESNFFGSRFMLRLIFITGMCLNVVHSSGQSAITVFAENFDQTTSLQPWAPYYSFGWFRGSPHNVFQEESGRGKALRVNFAAGTIGAESGFGNYRIPLDSAYKELYFSWEYFVPSFFDYGFADGLGGGKFFGGFTGGSMTAIPRNDAIDDDGWESILIFKNGSYSTYDYFKGSRYTSDGWPLGNHVTDIVKGQWRRITLRLKINDGDLSNGILEIFDNDVLVFQKTDVKVVNSVHPEYLIEHLYLNSFFGGSGASYVCPIDQYMAFDNLVAFYYPPGSPGYRSGPSEPGRVLQVPVATSYHPVPPNRFTPAAYTDASGTIESHCGFYQPVNQPESFQTSTIQVSGATYLNINVARFSFDKGVTYDGYRQILRIYEGVGAARVLKQTYQNGVNTTPGSITINGNAATIEWQAGVGSHNGFSINYTSDGTGTGRNFTCSDFFAKQQGVASSEPVIAVNAISVTAANGVSAISARGGTLQLTAAVLPYNATQKTVSWSVTGGTGQASVDDSGLVTAVADGSVTVRAMSNDWSGVYGTYTLAISNQTVTEQKPVTENQAPVINNQAFTIKEQEFTGNVIGTIVADPGDAGQSLTYEIASGNESGLFQVNAQTGVLSATSRSLFSYDPLAYSLVISAEDNGSTPKKSSATVQVNLVRQQTVYYIDPLNQGDPLQDGSYDHPYDSWNKVTWKEGFSYLQKKNTVAVESKINISAGKVTLGSYGEGKQPVIQSNVTDFALRAYEKSDLVIQDLHLLAPSAISCIYILGSSCDNIRVENCTLESAVNGVRILDGKNVVLSYNTFVNCSDAIYCYAETSMIYYNVFRDNVTAINALGNMASADIYNNVFYNNEVGIANSYSELTVYNNIFYLVNASDKAINNQLNTLISDHNIFFPEQEGFIQIADKRFSSLNEYQRNMNLDLNSFSQDPKFVDVYNANFSIDPLSPAINAGKTVGLLQDFYGTQVPMGGIPDIGLAELTGETRGLTSLFSGSTDQENEDLQVYPNPSNGIFNVSISNRDATASRIFLKDLSGRTVYENDYNSSFDNIQQINISNLNKGIYIVVVETGGKSLNQPIIVN